MCVEGAVKCNINLISHELNSRSQNILRSLGIPINCKMGKIQDFLCITILFWVSCRFFRCPEELHQALLGELRSGHETWIIGYPIANGQHICHMSHKGLGWRKLALVKNQPFTTAQQKMPVVLRAQMFLESSSSPPRSQHSPWDLCNLGRPGKISTMLPRYKDVKIFTVYQANFN